MELHREVQPSYRRRPKLLQRPPASERPASASIRSAAVGRLPDLAHFPPEPRLRDCLGRFFRGSDHPIPDPLRISRTGPRSPPHGSLQRNCSSNRGVDGTAAAERILRSFPPLPVARPRYHFRPGLPRASARYGYRGDPVSAALTLAARLCGTGDRLDSARVSRPSDRVP